MGRKKRRAHLVAGELNLVAMIDVAFQLLSFFIITVHPVDVFTNLNVLRPSPEAATPPDDKPLNMIRIMIFDKEVYTLNENPVNFPELDKTMTRLAKANKDQTILIMCRAESRHNSLIKVLDMCAKLKLTNLSVISSN